MKMRWALAAAGSAVLADKAYTNVGLLSAGGVVNAATQDSFCANTSCTITKIYDQTSNHSDLPISWGGLWKGPGPSGADAKALPLTVGGHKAYGVKVPPGVGYRVDNAKNAPTGSHPFPTDPTENTVQANFVSAGYQ